MAIDPKELRIGSHVDCKGSRYEVCGIYGDRIALIVKRHPLRGCESAHFSSDYISPIPITEDILAELGFCKKFDGGEWTMWTKDVDSFSVSIGLQDSVCKGAEIKDNDDKEAMFGWSYPCEYLHELESLYYHCTKQELIND